MFLNKPADMFVIFLLLAIILGQCIAQPKSIYLLAGQSNMSGRGGVANGRWDRVVPPECAPSSSIFRFAANKTWEQAREPLHVDIDLGKPTGVGPGMPFATTLLHLKPAVDSIGLVPCAIGGSFLRNWEKGQELYATLIDRAFASTRNGGVIQGLLWYQGEADAKFHETAVSYGKRFEQFIKDVRADLLSPDLPVILVALDKELRNARIIREAQLGLRMPNVKCVDALGLQLESDHTHLTTAAQVTLGKRMALAFLSLQH